MTNVLAARAAARYMQAMSLRDKVMQSMLVFAPHVKNYGRFVTDFTTFLKAEIGNLGLFKVNADYLGGPSFRVQFRLQVGGVTLYRRYFRHALTRHFKIQLKPWEILDLLDQSAIGEVLWSVTKTTASSPEFWVNYVIPSEGFHEAWPLPDAEPIPSKVRNLLVKPVRSLMKGSYLTTAILTVYPSHENPPSDAGFDAGTGQEDDDIAF